MLVMHSNNLFAMLWFTGRVAYSFQYRHEIIVERQGRDL